MTLQSEREGPQVVLSQCLRELSNQGRAELSPERHPVRSQDLQQRPIRARGLSWCNYGSRPIRPGGGRIPPGGGARRPPRAGALCAELAPAPPGAEWGTPGEPGAEPRDGESRSSDTARGSFPPAGPLDVAAGPSLQNAGVWTRVLALVGGVGFRRSFPSVRALPGVRSRFSAWAARWSSGVLSPLLGRLLGVRTREPPWAAECGCGVRGPSRALVSL